MSKQINYYMDKNTEHKFIQFALDNGLIFVKWSDGSKVNPFEDNSLFFFLTRDEYLSFMKFTSYSVDDFHSLVIEFSRNNIIEEKKIVTRGRIYISDVYKEKTVYTNRFIEDYNVLCKWIKKNVPYQNYTNKGKIQKEYISDSMLIYSEKNYHFQA